MGGSVGLPELFAVISVAGVLLGIVWPAARICRRTGFSPWLGILAVVPVVNVLLLWFIALARWRGSELARDDADARVAISGSFGKQRAAFLRIEMQESG
jgi:hypothetical protein